MAAEAALLAETQGNKATHTLHSELLFGLSPSKQVSEPQRRTLAQRAQRSAPEAYSAAPLRRAHRGARPRHAAPHPCAGCTEERARGTQRRIDTSHPVHVQIAGAFKTFGIAEADTAVLLAAIGVTEDAVRPGC